MVLGEEDCACAVSDKGDDDAGRDDAQGDGGEGAL